MQASSPLLKESMQHIKMRILCKKIEQTISKILDTCEKLSIKGPLEQRAYPFNYGLK